MHHRSSYWFPILVLVACSSPQREESGGTIVGGPAGDGGSGDDEGEGTIADSTGTGATTSGNTTQPSADDDTPPSPVVFDVGAGFDTEGGCGVGADATLTGTVLAPNGEIPVSGALVYTSFDEPEGIPQHVYCDECEELACDDHFTLTAADGTFSLNTASGNDRWLVVQKGQFMRITAIDIPTGDAALPAELTTLPGHNNPAAGEYIPLIAVGDASYDRLEDAFGKFGLGNTTISGYEEHLVPGTESFHLYDNGQSPASDGFPSQGTLAQLVADPAQLANYHMIFVPCSTNTHVGVLTQQNINNIREWVAAGGRWYVADWSNEWIEHVFPGYQTLIGEPNGADLGSYDSDGMVLDNGLLAWLEALPEPLKDINPLNDESHPTLFELPIVPTVDNWSVIIDTPSIIVDDGMGGMIDVGHKVWLEGAGGQGGAASHPLTVTGQYGCGKIQFTSYHAAEFFDYVGLSPQELVLMYTILEIGVCQENVPPAG